MELNVSSPSVFSPLIVCNHGNKNTAMCNIKIKRLITTLKTNEEQAQILTTSVILEGQIHPLNFCILSKDAVIYVGKYIATRWH